MAETKDYIDLLDPTQQETLKDELLKGLKTEEAKATRGRYPFCFKAAKLQAELELREYIEKLTQGHKNMKVPVINEDWLKQFKGPENFDVLGKTEAVDKVRVGIGYEQKLIGHHVNYVFKGTKFHVSIFEPLGATETK